MGVKNLTTYVKRVQKSVAEEVTLLLPTTSSPPAETDHGPLVFDGWAWIYRAYFDHVVDLIRGGDYVGYTLYVRQVVASLRASNLEPIFVFDGPYLPQKIPTVLSRMNEAAASNSVFMRSTYRFKASSQAVMSVPTLLYDCTLEALRLCNVQSIISETEADSSVAEMAERLGGWAVSNDSDFFILCSRGTKCRGYVPIDSIHYLVKPPLPKSATVETTESQDDDGFAPVRKSGRAQVYKPKVVAVERQAVSYHPPVTSEDGELLGVQFMAYSSTKLADVLGISPAMLPLLAAIAGNDYTSAVQRRILSPALPSGPEKIELIAQFIREEALRMSAPPGRPASVRSGSATPSVARAGLNRGSFAKSTGQVVGANGPPSASTSTTATPTATKMYPKLDEALAALALSDPVRYMVQKVIDRILATASAKDLDQHVASGDKDDLIDSVIDSVFTYSLLTHAESLHLSSPAASFFRKPCSQMTLAAYQKAYELGQFDRAHIETLALQMTFNKVSPEDPDQKSIQVTHARDVRRWVTTILFTSWGMDWARATLEEPKPEVEDDADDGEAHSRAIPILAGPGPNRVDWEKEGDPDELIPVQTPPSSFGSATNLSKDNEEDEEDDEDEIKSMPGSALGLLDEDTNDASIKPPPAIAEYARKGERYASDLCPIWSLDTLVQTHREELGIGPPQALHKYLLAH